MKAEVGSLLRIAIIVVNGGDDFYTTMVSYEAARQGCPTCYLRRSVIGKRNAVAAILLGDIERTISALAQRLG